MKEFSTFEKRIGVDFKDKNLLKTAFVHRSYINENPDKALEHNERLEFLGDAVLELAATEHLFKKFPQEPEGFLTALRAALVNTSTLSQTAAELGINEFLLLSKGEAKDTGRARQIILANTFEALIGAIYLDKGYEPAKDFIARFLFPKLDEILAKKLWIDAKSFFQEKAQEKMGVTPSYKVLKEWGPDHAKNFLVGVFLGKELVAEGKGHSKQEAEQNAARKALEVKGWHK